MNFLLSKVNYARNLLKISLIVLLTMLCQNKAVSFNKNTAQESFKEARLTKGDRNRLNRYYPKTLERIDKYQRLSLQDIINLTRSGVTDNVIIYEISATRSIFYLTPDDEKQLQQAGVSNKVMDAMKETSDTRY